MKLLLITYEFPPSGGVSVQRALSFARYLPSNGFEVHVLTARNPASPVRDEGLVARIPPEVRVHRTWSAEPSYQMRQRLWQAVSGVRAATASPAPETDAPKQGRAGGSWKKWPSRLVKRVLCPDPHVLWLPTAYRRACRIIEQEGIDVVLTTVPPFSLLLLANRLARRYPHLTMVSDFRDEWRRFFLNDFEFLQSEHTARRAAAIEREAVQRSTLVVAATRSSIDEIRRSHPDEPDAKFAHVANGYDPAAFANFVARSHGSAKIVVTYVGTVYKICSARYYLDALDELPDAIRSRFETRFVGRIIDEEQPFLQNRKSAIRLLGFLPHAEVGRLMEETDYLLVTVTNDFALAGKLFEYMATGKPVLAISPLQGETARLVKESGVGQCVDPFDREGIKRMLMGAYEGSIRRERELHADADQIRRYERPRLAAAMAGLIRQRAATHA